MLCKCVSNCGNEQINNVREPQTNRWKTKSENSPRWWLGHPLVLNERLTPFFNLNDLWKISQMIKRVHCTQKFVTLVVIMTTICLYGQFDVRSFRRHKLNWNLWWMKIKMIFNCYTFPLCKIVFAVLIFLPLLSPLSASEFVTGRALYNFK